MRPLSGERTERSVARRRLFLDPGHVPASEAGDRRSPAGVGSSWSGGPRGAGGRPVGDRVGAGAPGRPRSRAGSTRRLALAVRPAASVVGGAGRRRAGTAATRACRSAGLAVVFAIGLTLLSVRVLTGGWPSFNELLATDGNQPAFPAVRLGLAAAVTIAVAANTAVPVGTPVRHLDARPGHRGHAGRRTGKPIRHARRSPGRIGRSRLRAPCPRHLRRAAERR